MSASLFDSLTLAGVIELAGQPGGVVSTNPMCPGAVFTLNPEAWDLGDPQPTTDFVASLVVDGERPFGDRTSDRQPVITVFIKAPDFLTLAGAEELLLSTLDAQPSGQFTMTWTPRMTQAQINAGQLPLPTVFDCFRAKPSKKKWGGPTGYNNEPVSQIEITFDALPYGRSDTQQQLAFLLPVAALNAPAAPPAPVVLDDFSAINSPQFSQSGVTVVGSHSGYWDPASFGYPDGAGQPLTYSNVFATPVSLTGMTALRMWVGLGSRYYYNHSPRGRTPVSVQYTLTDTAGQQLSWTAHTGHLPVSQNPATPAWVPVSVRIPQTNPAFNFGSVAGYSLVMTNRGSSQLLPAGEFRWTSVHLNALTAYPSTTVAAAPAVRGTVYDVHGVAGTHRAPVSVTASQPAPGSATVITATGPGNYTVPATTIFCAVTGIGGGGPGATMTIAGAGGGGGGAEEAGEPQLPGSSAGVVIPYNVGAGGGPGTAGGATVFGPVPGQTLVVTANGGQAAVANSPTGALGGSGSVNTLHYPGGAGHTASGGVAGGGGSSAGTAAAGNSPAGATTQTFTSSGSVTIPAGAGPVTMGLWAAGGGGAAGTSSSPNGAGGGGGEYVPVVLTLAAGSYPFTIGAAGSGGSGSGGGGQPGTAGGNTSITIGGTTYTAHGGAGGVASDGGPGGAGGTGSGLAGAEPGGQGGSATYGSGGGSSAGPGAAGNAGSQYGAGGAAPTGGGSGGAGAGSSSSVNGSAGTAQGGAGGGSYVNGHAGGAGAGGQISFAYATSAFNTGATAPAGGGNGGAGAASAGSAGSNGSQPGGAGGGGNSTGSPEAGGTGGNGKITVTPYVSAAFSTLLLHLPGLLAPPSLNPLVVIGGAPGATEYAVASLVSGVNAQFHGTYTVLLAANTWNSSSSPRTITVTVNQYEATGGTKWSTSTAAVTITPPPRWSTGSSTRGTSPCPTRRSGKTTAPGTTPCRSPTLIPRTPFMTSCSLIIPGRPS